MIIQQKKFSLNKGWEFIKNVTTDTTGFQLVLVFGSSGLLRLPVILESIKKSYPEADVVLCSTVTEIADTEINSEGVSLTAIKFQKTYHKIAVLNQGKFNDSSEAGNLLADLIPKENLVSILVFCDSQLINSSELISSMQQSLPQHVKISGGLTGNGEISNKALIGINELPTENKLLAIGLYGSLIVTNGTHGGCKPFGPERLITRSKGNVLFELDHQPALNIYKRYLGERAVKLSEFGHLFPLGIRKEHKDKELVRSILAINEEDKSLVFAGNIPQGFYARLMIANGNNILEGAYFAAQDSMKDLNEAPELALLVSCVGRKLILNQRVEEEVEVMREIYGKSTCLAGFYSFGELATNSLTGLCELHNETMTITTLSER